ncbi:flagellar biosynthesis protein FlhF [Bacillus oleivorans]|uniref:Flagellar biosynthesis protein FlhF n=1 Tax=Bacillus oleivorans TaxID=1448271 RepID=A0A285D305_9BACI|nr:flagellar biosynthesis protein FlhF [Bacillus oleivorans]SNX73696.1 flagellar biosynthesis protein FlhF [Bacillus oleivorans]
MKFKKYMGPSLPEVMKKVRAELGQNAVIINSKTVYKGGVMGLFKKKYIEVVAAIDPSAVEPVKLPSQHPEKLAADMAAVTTRSKMKEYNPDLGLLLKEVQQLKQGLYRTQAEFIVPEALKPMLNLLAEQGVAPFLLNQWAPILTELYYKEQKPENTDKLKSLLAQTIFEGKDPLLDGSELLEKKFVALVGPTGVGKTTTLAKLAAKSILKDRKKVAFITTDTYRIAAIEQLKTYANIVGAPVEVCYNLEDFSRAKARFSNYDTIFIDTAGRNFRNGQYVEDLKEVIDFKEDVQTFLTIALTAKEYDIKQIIEQFSQLHIDRFIFTKLDETSQIGMILNLIWDTGIGVGFLTTGQNVPDDLKVADKEWLLSHLLGDM